MSFFNDIRLDNKSIGTLPNGGMLMANPFIIFDGKTLNTDDSINLWENVGTGTFSFNLNKMSMSVTSGQYCIRQSRRRMPYISGYPQIIEMTFDNFNSESGVVKRVGYFSSSSASTYSASTDGFWLEASNSTYYLRASRTGTSTVDVPFTAWTGYNLLSSYDFNNFSAIYFDFLWLGGAGLRIFICTPDKGWVLGHAAEYIGNNQDTICTSPNQPTRYEIVSTDGTGDMRAICSQVSIGGDVSNLGFNRTYLNKTGVPCNIIGTTYALMGFKKKSSYRDVAVKLVELGCTNGATVDTGILLLLKNPTLSASLTYSGENKIDIAIATTQTVTEIGTIVAITPNGGTANKVPSDDYMGWFTQTISDSFDEYVLAYRPASTNQTIYGYSILKEY